MDRNPNPKQIPLTRAMVAVLRDAVQQGRSYYVTATPSTYNAMLSRGLIRDTADGVRLTTEGVRTMNSLA
jgi:hypothetical protein